MKMNLKMTNPSMAGIVLEDAAFESFAQAEKLEQRKRLVEEQKKKRLRAEEEARRRAEEEARRAQEVDFVQKKKHSSKSRGRSRLRAEEEARRQLQPVEEDLNFDDYLADDNLEKTRQPQTYGRNRRGLSEP